MCKLRPSKKTRIHHDLSSNISSLAAGLDVLKKIEKKETLLVDKEEVIKLMDDAIKELLKNWKTYLKDQEKDN